MANKNPLLRVEGRNVFLGDYSFSIGEPIEVLICEELLSGFLEYSHGDKFGYVGWYFTNGSFGWCPIVSGMIARRGYAWSLRE